MAKGWLLFSIVFIVWFLLVDQRIITKTAGSPIGSSIKSGHKDFLVIDNSSSFKHSTKILAETEKSDVPTDDDDDDIIELNVGGQKISTLRSTLTAVPNSKLALIFTKNNTDVEQSRDKEVTVFFDYNPVQFNYLLDQLRIIKRSPQIPAYELNIQTSQKDTQMNFSYMISDLGLAPEQFLYPLAGTHLNLQVNSLIGWDECYRSTYDTPFNLSASMMNCRSKRVLVACHSADNDQNLVLAGVGKWQDIFRECSSINNCPADLKNGISFYYVNSQAWGFEGRPKDFNQVYNPYNHYNYNTQLVNPCDASDQHSDYRLCWSLRSNLNRGGGDRCGSMKNLQNAADWERVIYRVV